MGYDDTANLRKPGILANSESYAKEETAIAQPMKRKPLKAKKKSRKRKSKY